MASIPLIFFLGNASGIVDAYLGPEILEVNQPNIVVLLANTLPLIAVGLTGMVYNRKNFLVTMMNLELIYLGSGASLIVYGVAFQEAAPQIYALILIIVAAAEVALGLGLLIVVFKAENRVDPSPYVFLRD